MPRPTLSSPMPVPYKRSSSSPASFFPVWRKVWGTSKPPISSTREVRRFSIISLIGASTSVRNCSGIPPILPSGAIRVAINALIGSPAFSVNSPGKAPISVRRGSKSVAMSSSVNPISPRLIASILLTISSRITSAMPCGSRSISIAVIGLIALTNSSRKMPAAAGSSMKPGVPSSKMRCASSGGTPASIASQ